ncbi:pentatricopeptide repeat-containing protein, partial [Trifolium pratense]
MAMDMAMATISHTHTRLTTHHQLLTALSSSTTLSHLKQIHTQILHYNSNNNEHSNNTLLSKLVLSICTLSSSSSSLHYALSVFSQIPNPQTHLSNKLLRHLSRSPFPEKTLFLYQKLRTIDASTLDRFSFPPLLKAVSKVCAFNHGLEIHGLASKLGLVSDPFIETGLIAMYASCRRIMDARLLFDKMSHPDAIAWNTIIDG